MSQQRPFGHERVGLCVVGPGAIAAAHMRAIENLAVAENIWVIGRTQEKASAFADNWGFLQSQTDLAVALADDAVNVVLITSPNALHYQQTLDALAAGKHVIVEIPVAMSFSDAQSLSDTAARLSLRVFVCHTMRSFPAIRQLNDRVRAGTLNITQISSFTATPRRNNENWGGGTRNWVDDLLWHNSCHYLDASLWVLGSTDTRNECAQFGHTNRDFGMTMDLAVSFTTSRSQVVSLSSTYNVARSAAQMRFVADEGLFVLEGTQLVDDAGREIAPAVDWDDLSMQNEAILTSLIEGSASDYDVESVMPTMRLLESAQASLRE